MLKCESKVRLYNDFIKPVTETAYSPSLGSVSDAAATWNAGGTQWLKWRGTQKGVPDGTPSLLPTLALAARTQLQK